MAAIYTVGYSGWNPDKFVERLTLLGVHVIDVRLKPWSHSVAFQRNRLKQTLPRYTWLGNVFGNRNYASKREPIVLVNALEGVQCIKTLFSDSKPPVFAPNPGFSARSVVAEPRTASGGEGRACGGPLCLLCGCASPRSCHRSQVATLVREALGLSEIVHLFPHAADQVERFTDYL